MLSSLPSFWLVANLEGVIDLRILRVELQVLRPDNLKREGPRGMKKVLSARDSSSATDPADPISEFAVVVDALYGVYLDATTGFKKFLEYFEKMQQDTIAKLAESDPEIANMEYLDNRLFHYG